MKTELNIDERSETDSNEDMAPPKAPKNKRPSPDELLAEVRGRGPAKTYDFEDYLDVIHEMQGKDFSFAKIADFLTERLGYAITRGQVYRAYQNWLEIKKQIEQEEAELAFLARQQADEEFDPESHELQEDDRKLSQARGDILKYALDKYPEGSLSVGHADLFKGIVAFLDDKARDDFEAEQADKRKESSKNKSDER